ncbi:hypothetical protein CHISP_0664 [Chitinispirillum alkaliphilum]|nr:hypothetical protein CHISP_0664 [Chitinispirillum alkaliphilum]
MTGPIIIVDDMEIALTVIKTVLLNAGYPNVITFENPKDALQFIENSQIPSFIISDYNMPFMNGVEFLDTVFSIYPHVPSILVSGDSHTVTKEKNNYQIIEKGGNDFFKLIIKALCEAQISPYEAQTEQFQKTDFNLGTAAKTN